MKTAYEAVIHKAVVGPVFLLAGMIEATEKLCRTATDVADRVAGEPRRSRPGFGRLRTA